MARHARARRALCDTQPDQELGVRTWRWRCARSGYRGKHRYFLSRQRGLASAAPLPRRRAPRLGRNVMDQHRTHQPGRLRSRLSRLAGTERRVREDGGVLRWRRFLNHRRRPRRVCQPPVRLGRFLCRLRPDRVCGTPADAARCPGGRRGANDRRRAVSLGIDALRQRRGRDRENDHRVRQPDGDRRSGRAGISLSRRRGSLGALAHDQRRYEPQPVQLPSRREAQERRGPHACAGADADHWRHARAAISGESPEDGRP